MYLHINFSFLRKIDKYSISYMMDNDCPFSKNLELFFLSTIYFFIEQPHGAVMPHAEFLFYGNPVCVLSYALLNACQIGFNRGEIHHKMNRELKRINSVVNCRTKFRMAKKVMKKPRNLSISGFSGGRYRTRTYDLPHVKRML